MKTFLASFYEKPNHITIKEESLKLSSEDTLIKINACTICGYDTKVFRYGNKKVKPPVTLGHEISGEAVSDICLGNGTSIPKGTRVAICPIVPCLTCLYCDRQQYNLCINLKELGSSLNGGFAEYLLLPKNILKIGGIIPVPDSISLEEISLLEPLACCINGLRQNLIVNNSIVVIIGDGPIGLLYLQLFKIMNIKSIVVGKIPSRLAKAKELGAIKTISFEKDLPEIIKPIYDLTEGIGSQYIVIATSNQDAFELAKLIVQKNGIIHIFAGAEENSLIIDLNWVHLNQITMYGSFSSSPIQLRKALRIVMEKKINLSTLISNRFSLTNIETALETAENYIGIKTLVKNY